METVFFHDKIRFYSHLLNQTIYFDYLNHYKMTFLMPDEKSNINSYTVSDIDLNFNRNTI